MTRYEAIFGIFTVRRVKTGFQIRTVARYIKYVFEIIASFHKTRRIKKHPSIQNINNNYKGGTANGTKRAQSIKDTY